MKVLILAGIVDRMLFLRNTKLLQKAKLSATALSVPVAIKEATSCDNDKFVQQCLSTFAQKLGVSLSTNVTVFEKEYMAACEKAGYNAINLTCNANDYLDKCVGGAEGRKACLSVENLKQLGLPDISAYTYAAYGGAFEAECDPAIKPILNQNIVCMGKAYKTAGYNKCIVDYIAAVTAHPENICTLGQDYGNCMQDVYATVCPDPVPLAMCDVTVAAVKATAPQCTFKCGQCVDNVEC